MVKSFCLTLSMVKDRKKDSKCLNTHIYWHSEASRGETHLDSNTGITSIAVVLDANLPCITHVALLFDSKYSKIWIIWILMNNANNVSNYSHYLHYLHYLHYSHYSNYSNSQIFEYLGVLTHIIQNIWVFNSNPPRITHIDSTCFNSHNTQLAQSYVRPQFFILTILISHGNWILVLPIVSLLHYP